MAPRFKIDTSKHVYNFQYLFHIRRRKQNKTSRNEGMGGKNGKNIFFVILYYKDLVDGFQRLIEACEKQVLGFPINIYFY